MVANYISLTVMIVLPSDSVTLLFAALAAKKPLLGQRNPPLVLLTAKLASGTMLVTSPPLPMLMTAWALLKNSHSTPKTLMVNNNRLGAGRPWTGGW
jgi:hypothetical protein